MTIKDIARESGYSVGTVSRVLNQTPGVSDRAREAVMEVVKKYRFQLNSNAKHLKQQTRNGVAILIKGTQNMLFASIVEQMQSLLKKRNYDSLIYYIGEDDDEVEHALLLCKERHPLGILFLGSNTAGYVPRFEEVTIPCVLVTNSAADLGYDNLSSITTDDVAATCHAIEYLYSMGHREIGILGGAREHSQAAEARFRGLIQAFSNLGLTFDENRQYEASHFDMNEGYRSMENLLNKMPEVTAVFAMSDVMAVGAMRAIADRGLRVPEDISIIGFDGIDIGRYMNPRLTTIRQHRESMAIRSVDILISRIEEDLPAIHEVEPFHLVTGESVARR